MEHPIEMLVLNPDADLQVKLQRKLDDYAQRLAKANRPEQLVDLTLKHGLLDALLKDGAVDILAFQAKLGAQHLFTPQTFWNAVNVIAAYNAEETFRLTGGTGLN